MFTHNYNFLPILLILLGLSYSCSCLWIPDESFNATLAGKASFSPAVATWYGNPTGAGSGGACGLANDVAQDPYRAFISAGNDRLFRGGSGCGNCYLVKCTENPSCSSFPIAITITDQCPGACNNEPFHFDLSGTAFGALAKRGQAENLRNAGRINVLFQRIRCNYKANIKFRIDNGSNRFYLAFVVENVNGFGDIKSVELLPSKPRATWVPMQRSFGATWKIDLNEGLPGPYSVRITGPETSKSVIADKVIPANWQNGQFYYSNLNF